MEKLASYLRRVDPARAVIDGAEETGQADDLARALVERLGQDALARVAEMLSEVEAR